MPGNKCSTSPHGCARCGSDGVGQTSVSSRSWAAVVDRLSFRPAEVAFVVREGHGALGQSAHGDPEIIAAVAGATEGFSGAEIEELVINALHEACSSAERTLKTAHLLNAVREIRPLAFRRSRKVEGLRRWAADNCRMAARSEAEKAVGESDRLASRRVRMVDL